MLTAAKNYEGSEEIDFYSFFSQLLETYLHFYKMDPDQQHFRIRLPIKVGFDLL